MTHKRLLMNSRALLVGLIVLATIGFVVGVSTEKSDEHHESAALTSVGEGGHAESGEEESHSQAGGDHGEFEPLGINLESTPLIVLAALGSLVLAAAVWLRSRWLAALAVTCFAMAVFAALDIAEVVHQSDVDKTGLAVLAAFVALLHLAASLVALRMVAATNRRR
jgi:hypothetical protein